MTEENDFPNQIADGNQNKNAIQCQFCDSIILKAKSAYYSENECNLPMMHQKNKEYVTQSEVLKNYWQVNDMFTFENIGFSNTVQDKKYLICADCEMGPVGYHDMASKICYVALKRVKHVK